MRLLCAHAGYLDHDGLAGVVERAACCGGLVFGLVYSGLDTNMRSRFRSYSKQNCSWVCEFGHGFHDQIPSPISVLLPNAHPSSDLSSIAVQIPSPNPSSVQIPPPI